MDDEYYVVKNHLGSILGVFEDGDSADLWIEENHKFYRGVEREAREVCHG
jgi:hypothetical protein